MLNRKNRIGSPNTIESLFRKSEVLKGRFLIFRYELKEDPESRFAVIVSKKTCRKAVPRNRLRRQIQEAIRRNLPILKRPMNALVIARPSAKDHAFQEMEKDIVTIFNRLD
jgi:ribonuclease P protein component